MRGKRKVSHRGNAGKRLVELLCGAILLWVLVVLMYRVAPPPMTPLMVIRKVQAFWSAETTVSAWTWIPLRTLPAHIPQAIVTAEDARFMDHWGVDVLAVGDALDAAGKHGQLRGASTITMQTVKNLFLWPGRSYIRKVLEWGMAPIAGLIWGKYRTLELYINIIEWGEGIYGLEAAARHYFRKNAAQLSRREAAALASILPNPRKLSPTQMGRSTRRRYERIVREASSTKLP